jgi:hypothetical protein
MVCHDLQCRNLQISLLGLCIISSSSTVILVTFAQFGLWEVKLNKVVVIICNLHNIFHHVPLVNFDGTFLIILKYLKHIYSKQNTKFEKKIFFLFGSLKICIVFKRV